MEVLAGALIAGVSSAIQFGMGTALVSFALTAISSGILYWMSKKNTGGVTPELLTRVIRSAAMPKRYIYGKVVTSGLLAYVGTPTGDAYKSHLHIVIILAAHKVKHIGDVWFNDLLSYNCQFQSSTVKDSMDTQKDNEYMYNNFPTWVSTVQYKENSYVKYLAKNGTTYKAFRCIKDLDARASYISPDMDHKYWEEFGHWYTIRRHLGDETEVDSTLHSEPGVDAKDVMEEYKEGGLGEVLWPESMKLRGMAYIVIKLRFYAKAKTYPNGIPNIKAEVEGFDTIYNPTDVVIGGINSHAEGYSTNPVLCIAHYLTHTHGLNRNNLLSAEVSDSHTIHNVYEDIIDVDQIKEEAQCCDEVILSGIKDKAAVSGFYNSGGSSGCVTTGGKFLVFDYTIYGDLRDFSSYVKTASKTYRIRIRVKDADMYYFIGFIKEIIPDGVYKGFMSIYTDEACTVPGLIPQSNGRLRAGRYWGESVNGDTNGESAGDPFFSSPADATSPECYFLGHYVMDSFIIYDDTCFAKRYMLNGIMGADEKPINIVQEMLLSMAGNVVWFNGKYRIYSGRYRTPTAVIQESDFQSDLTIAPLISRKDFYNTANGTFYDESQDYANVEIGEVTNSLLLAKDMGRNYATTIDFKYVSSRSQAARISMITMNKARTGMKISSLAKFTCFPLHVMQNVYLQSSILWPALSVYTDFKVFTIDKWSLVVPSNDNSGGISLSLSEEESANYDIYLEDMPADTVPVIDKGDFGVTGNITIDNGVIIQSDLDDYSGWSSNGTVVVSGENIKGLYFPLKESENIGLSVDKVIQIDVEPHYLDAVSHGKNQQKGRPYWVKDDYITELPLVPVEDRTDGGIASYSHIYDNVCISTDPMVLAEYHSPDQTYILVDNTSLSIAYVNADNADHGKWYIQDDVFLKGYPESVDSWFSMYSDLCSLIGMEYGAGGAWSAAYISKNPKPTIARKCFRFVIQSGGYRRASTSYPFDYITKFQAGVAYVGERLILRAGYPDPDNPGSTLTEDKFGYGFFIYKDPELTIPGWQGFGNNVGGSPSFEDSSDPLLHYVIDSRKHVDGLSTSAIDRLISAHIYDRPHISVEFERTKEGKYDTLLSFPSDLQMVDPLRNSNVYVSINKSYWVEEASYSKGGSYQQTEIDNIRSNNYPIWFPRSATYALLVRSRLVSGSTKGSWGDWSIILRNPAVPTNGKFKAVKVLPSSILLSWSNLSESASTVTLRSGIEFNWDSGTLVAEDIDVSGNSYMIESADSSDFRKVYMLKMKNATGDVGDTVLWAIIAETAVDTVVTTTGGRVIITKDSAGRGVYVDDMTIKETILYDGKFNITTKYQFSPGTVEIFVDGRFLTPYYERYVDNLTKSTNDIYWEFREDITITGSGKDIEIRDLSSNPCEYYDNNSKVIPTGALCTVKYQAKYIPR